MTSTPLLSFIIVNYKSAELLPACVASIRKNVRFPYEIIIVNNDSQELGNNIAQENVFIIESGVNKGFGSGCNLGATHARSDIFLFLNPDAQLETGNMIDIVTHIQRHGGIVGPRLVGRDRQTQPWSVGCDVTLSEVVRSNLGVACSKKLWRSRRQQDVAWVSGAALCVDRAHFEKAKGFDEQFFLYYEDVDLCRRVRSLGGQVRYMPHVRVLHETGGSVTSLRKQKKQYYQSQDYYFTKHFGKQKQKILSFLRTVVRPLKT